MSLAIWFWLCMFIWLLFGFYRSWGEPSPYYGVGGHLLHFLILAILGVQVFGSPVK